MNVLNKLVESQSSIHARKIMKENGMTYYPRKFNPIQYERFNFSIQVAEHAYCSPRITSDDLSVYTHVEFALLNENGWLKVSEVLPTFSMLEDVEHYGIDDVVYSYVPIEIVNTLYMELNEVYG